jgi:hypothetical protein
MSAIDELMNKPTDEMTPLERAVYNEVRQGYNARENAIEAAAELARLQQIEAAGAKALPVLKRLSEAWHMQHHTGDLESCRQDSCIINRATVTILAAALDRKP